MSIRVLRCITSAVGVRHEPVTYDIPVGLVRERLHKSVQAGRLPASDLLRLEAGTLPESIARSLIGESAWKALIEDRIAKLQDEVRELGEKLRTAPRPAPSSPTWVS